MHKDFISISACERKWGKAERSGRVWQSDPSVKIEQERDWLEASLTAMPSKGDSTRLLKSSQTKVGFHRSFRSPRSACLCMAIIIISHC